MGVVCEWGFACEKEDGSRATVEPNSEGIIECESDGNILCSACKQALDEINC